MAKFKFRLAGLLDLKQKVEGQKEAEYGMAMGELSNEEQKLAALNTELSDCLTEFQNNLDKIDPPLYQRYNYFIEAQKRRIVEQKQAVKRAEIKVEQKRAELQEAIKERKTLEKLKEKDYEEYLKEEKSKEQKLVDEFVSYKYSTRE